MGWWGEIDGSAVEETVEEGPKNGGKGRKERDEKTHHVVQKRLHQTLRTSVSTATFPLVRSYRVERVDGASSVAVDTGD
jgi:hypothetical protein